MRRAGLDWVAHALTADAQQKVNLPCLRLGRRATDFAAISVVEKVVAKIENWTFSSDS